MIPSANPKPTWSELMASGPHKRTNGRWEIRWREGTRNRSKTFASEKAATDFKRDIETRLESGLPVIMRRDSLTLKELCLQTLSKRNIQPQTQELYLRWLNKHVFPQIGHLPIIDCHPERLDEWQTERLARGAGPATIGKVQTLLGSVFRRAVKLRLIDYNPMDALDRPGYEHREAQWLTAEQVEAIRRYYLDLDDPGSAALVSVLAYVGVRPQAALALRREDVGERLTVVGRNVDGRILPGSKTSARRRRALYLPEPVRVDLDNWVVLRDLKPGELLFGRADGQAWTKHDYDNWRSRPVPKVKPNGKPRPRPKCFARAAEVAGVSGASPYALRHTAASLYLAAGWTPAEVAHQLDHSIGVSMDRYQHLIEQAVDAPRRSIDEWIWQARGIEPVRRTFAEEGLSA